MPRSGPLKSGSLRLLDSPAHWSRFAGRPQMSPHQRSIRMYIYVSVYTDVKTYTRIHDIIRSCKEMSLKNLEIDICNSHMQLPISMSIKRHLPSYLNFKIYVKKLITCQNYRSAGMRRPSRLCLRCLARERLGKDKRGGEP